MTTRETTAPVTPVTPGAPGPARRRVGAAVLGALTRLPDGAVLLALTAAVVMIGWLQKYPCNDGHSPPDYGWTHACYTDVLPLYGGRGFGEGHLPYLDSLIEYPVLIGLYMGVIGLPIHWLNAAGLLSGPAHALGFGGVDEGLVFFWATAFFNGLLVLATTRMLLALRRNRPTDVLLWVLAPGMALAFTVNWDMLAVAPAVAGLLAWQRRRPGLAGVLLGIGTAAKLFPVMILFPLVLLCLRRRTPEGRRVALRVVLGAAGAWLVLNVPFAIANFTNWWEAYRFSRDRWIDWGTLYFLGDHLSTPLGLHDQVWSAVGQVDDLNRTSALLFLLALAGIATLVLRAPQPPRVAAMAFLTVAAFLLTNKVWSQQFVLWLIPLAVLARPRWKAILLWQAVEVAYLLAFLRSVIAGRDDYALVQTALARYVAVAALAVMVIVEALRPEQDPLRGPDLADPDAGPLAEEPVPAGARVPAEVSAPSAPQVGPGHPDLGEQLA